MLGVSTFGIPNAAFSLRMHLADLSPQVKRPNAMHVKRYLAPGDVDGHLHQSN